MVVLVELVEVLLVVALAILGQLAAEPAVDADVREVVAAEGGAAVACYDRRW